MPKNTPDYYICYACGSLHPRGNECPRQIQLEKPLSPVGSLRTGPASLPVSRDDKAPAGVFFGPNGGKTYLDTVTSPFLETLAERERARLRHYRVLEWAIIATVAAVMGWGFLAMVLIQQWHRAS